MLVSHGPRPPENVRIKNTSQIIGGVSGRTIWASADSEPKTVFTRFPESERCSSPVRQVASPQIDRSARRAPESSLGLTVGPVVPRVTGKRRRQLPHISTENRQDWE
jgi:hypothetical protein